MSSRCVNRDFFNFFKFLCQPFTPKINANNHGAGAESLEIQPEAAAAQPQDAAADDKPQRGARRSMTLAASASGSSERISWGII